MSATDDLEDLENILQANFADTADFVRKQIMTAEKTATVMYLRSVCDENKVAYLFKGFFETGSMDEFRNFLISQPTMKRYQDHDQALRLIMAGSVIVFVQNEAFLTGASKNKNQSNNKATNETVIQGPQHAFSESLEVNVTILRQRYPQPSLTIKNMEIGKLNKTKIAVVFDKTHVNQETLKRIISSVQAVDLDVLQAAGQLQRAMTEKEHTLFPTMMITERPDRMVFNLASGKVAIVIDGTPFVLIAPCVFYDFVSAMEDTYQSFWISRFFTTLRYIGLFVSVTLPGLYVAVVSYNPELFRVELTLSVAASRAGVPYPSYIEVLLMLTILEMLVEASIRLPKAIGSTATTVGGLILGQAATEANLVSSIMIIITSAVAISNFVIPINAMAFAMRVVKYMFVFLASVFGLAGVAVGVIGLIAYLVSLDSFGEPYLKIYTGKRSIRDEYGLIRKENKG